MTSCSTGPVLLGCSSELVWSGGVAVVAGANLALTLTAQAAIESHLRYRFGAEKNTGFLRTDRGEPSRAEDTRTVARCSSIPQSIGPRPPPHADDQRLADRPSARTRRASSPPEGREGRRTNGGCWRASRVDWQGRRAARPTYSSTTSATGAPSGRARTLLPLAVEVDAGAHRRVRCRPRDGPPSRAAPHAGVLDPGRAGDARLRAAEAVAR